MKTTVPAGDRLVAATLASLIEEQIPGLRFVAAPHVPDARWEGCREWRTL
jgi:hypothetical protein